MLVGAASASRRRPRTPRPRSCCCTQAAGGAAAAPRWSRWRVDFEARGYRTVTVEYPLHHGHAVDRLHEGHRWRERLRGEPVIAYGISAGGTIAAALAATGLVDGAVNVIGPTDFTTWISPAGLLIINDAHMTAAEKVSASPYFRLDGRSAPQLVQCGLLDLVTTYDQCERYVTRAAAFNPDTTLQRMLNRTTRDRRTATALAPGCRRAGPSARLRRRRSRPRRRSKLLAGVRDRDADAARPAAERVQQVVVVDHLRVEAEIGELGDRVVLLAPDAGPAARTIDRRVTRRRARPPAAPAPTRRRR